ncbi:RNA-binding S4 domain-containing protein [Roseateles sp.]|uniref:RNA-binding S4 domain-containing protein n=1 Tax=Roseateles sp. TaxID=1971397 RepID=UPI003934F6A9
MRQLELRGDYIELDKLLKAVGLVSSGGEARMRISEGEVTVDGAQELRKTAKIRAGQVVAFAGEQVQVLGSSASS